MAYSRWSNSYWYTFWTFSDSELKENQIFDVCTLRVFSYKELTTNINNCLLAVRESVEQEIKEKLDDTVYEELKGYMKEFIKDVDKEYNE